MPLYPSVFNPFPNIPWFLRVFRTSLLKTLWEKEKLLVASNFSFIPSVFSSTGQRASELLSWRCVRRPSVRPSVRASVNSSFKKLLLKKYGLDFYQTSQECSVYGPLSNSFKYLCSMKNSGCHCNQSKKPLKIFSSQTTNWIALLFCRNVP